ncbi:hypothetical protein LY13_005014 [Prauserella aidingensis]|uniref:hypothetical protein n=1 Tax=Prauserella aidingensis TaxID=387890 RepID=UPI0020A4B892|nr:hypothetical protein [Prauserella aidingensis]MCP2256227.1 hypothetical protein [Prauserella aidingensis]
MAPTAPRPTPHEDALLDRTGIICASGHGPAAPPTPGINRSGAAGFVAFVVMVLAAVTGVSGLEGDGGGSRLVAGDEVTEAAPQVTEGSGSDEQRGDGPAAGTDEDPGDAAQSRKGGDVQGRPVSPDVDVDARSDEVQVPADAATDPADDSLAHGLAGPVPGVARAEPAAAGTNVTGSDVASARKADTAARETTRTSGTRVVGAWTSWQDRAARDRSAVERRVQRFGEELRRSIESHTTRHYGFRAPDTDARSRGARSDDVPGDDVRGRDAARGEGARGGARRFEAILNTVTHAMRGHGPVQHIPTRQARQERGEAGERDGGEPVQSRSDVDENAEGEQVRSGDGRADRDGRDGSPHVVGERGWHDGGLPGSDARVDRHGYGEQPSYEDMNRTHEPRVDGARDDGYYGGSAYDGPDHRGGAYGGHGYGGYGAGW